MPVTELQKMEKWLMTYPAWEGLLRVDFLNEEIDQTVLFPQGLEEVSRTEDVLGNRQVLCRYRFLLRRRTSSRYGGDENAQWLLNFQNWVHQQSNAGRTPHFGDVPGAERMQAFFGELEKHEESDTYVVTLIAEFMKVYEVK